MSESNLIIISHVLVWKNIPERKDMTKQNKTLATFF